MKIPLAYKLILRNTIKIYKYIKIVHILTVVTFYGLLVQILFFMTYFSPFIWEVVLRIILIVIFVIYFIFFRKTLYQKF